jgi:uncharacterized protein (DUF1499 family)
MIHYQVAYTAVLNNLKKIAEFVPTTTSVNRSTPDFLAREIMTVKNGTRKVDLV